MGSTFSWYEAKKIGCNFLPYLHKDTISNGRCVVPLRKEDNDVKQ